MGDSGSADSSSGCDPAVKPTSKRPNEIGLGMTAISLARFECLECSRAAWPPQEPYLWKSRFFPSFNLKSFPFLCPKIAANFDYPYRGSCFPEWLREGLCETGPDRGGLRFAQGEITA